MTLATPGRTGEGPARDERRPCHELPAVDAGPSSSPGPGTDGGGHAGASCTRRGREAPGAPGAVANWTPGDKSGVGTATTGVSTVWFTLGDGEFTEVYFPDLGTPSVRDLQFVVSDGQTFVEREHDDANHVVRMVEGRCGAPARGTTRTCCASTWQTSATSSNPILAGPTLSTPSPTWAYRFLTGLDLRFIGPRAQRRRKIMLGHQVAGAPDPVLRGRRCGGVGTKLTVTQVTAPPALCWSLGRRSSVR